MQANRRGVGAYWGSETNVQIKEHAEQRRYCEVLHSAIVVKVSPSSSGSWRIALLFRAG
jgi:hypothetical protein